MIHQIKRFTGKQIPWARLKSDVDEIVASKGCDEWVALQIAIDRATTTVAERIRAARERTNQRPKDLCVVAGLQQPTLSRYESGKTIPGIEALAKIAKALDVRMEWLATGEEPMEARSTAATGTDGGE